MGLTTGGAQRLALPDEHTDHSLAADRPRPEPR